MSEDRQCYSSVFRQLQMRHILTDLHFLHVELVLSEENLLISKIPACRLIECCSVSGIRIERGSKEWKLDPKVIQLVIVALGPRKIDFFASRLTAQFPMYMS